MSREAVVMPSSELHSAQGRLWVPVNPEDLAMSKRVWDNPYARIAAAMRRSMMLANGISINRVVNGKEFSMRAGSEHVQLKLAWAKFAHEVDIKLMLYGFVLFRVDQKTAVPMTMEPGDVRVYVNHEDGLTRYIVTRVSRSGLMHTQNDIPGLRVIERTAPSITGRLSCEAITLYKHLIPHDLALDLAPIAWLSEARPTVFLRATDPGIDDSSRLVDTAMHGDVNFNVLLHERATREARLDDIAEREQMRTEAFIQSVHLDSRTTPMSASTLRAVDTRATMLAPNIFPLPSNSQIDQVVHPSFHTNIEEIGNYFAMMVSRLMGVPAFDTGRSGARYTAAVALTTANDTIRASATELEVILSSVATNVLMPYMMAHTLEVARHRGAADTEEVGDIGQVTVKIHCSMSFDTVQNLYRLGMMTHAQFAEAASLSTHVPRHLFSTYHVDPLSGAKYEDPGVGDGNPKPAKRARPGTTDSRRRALTVHRPKTDIEHAEDNLKGADSTYTGHPN